MSTIQLTTKHWPRVIASHAIGRSQRRPRSSVTTVRYASDPQIESYISFDYELAKRKSPLSSRANWANREYREAYMEAAIEQGIAWQIRINRTKRGLSQEELAKLLNTQQSAVSRLEDPEYGSHNLETLIQIAKAFDCALSVRFISYSALAEEADQLTEDRQFAIPYSAETENVHGEK